MSNRFNTTITVNETVNAYACYLRLAQHLLLTDLHLIRIKNRETECYVCTEGGKPHKEIKLTSAEFPDITFHVEYSEFEVDPLIEVVEYRDGVGTLIRHYREHSDYDRPF